MSESCRETCRIPVTRSREAHCTVCHKTFSGATWFDIHRIGGRCQDVSGLVELDGLWATEDRHKNNVVIKERMTEIRRLQLEPE